MTWKNVQLIFHREVRDQLRDRRTLFMVAVLPLLLYPALGLGMVQMALLFREQSRTVVVLGADELPPPELFDGEQFVPNYFRIPADAAKLRVVSDAPIPVEPEDETATPMDVAKESKDTERLEAAREMIAIARRMHDLNEEATALSATSNKDARDDTPPDDRVGELRAEAEELKLDLGRRFEEADFEVLVAFPEGFAEEVAEFNRHLSEGDLSSIATTKVPQPIVLYNAAREKSLIAYRRVQEAMDNWEDAVLRDRLASANLPQSLTTPINVESVDIAKQDQVAANVWSKLFPTLLVVMAVTGAFYPAIDLGAGEKERGTMETLLICPATRTEIVVGKFLTVMLFSISSALLNLVSMGFTGKYMISIAGAGRVTSLGGVSFPPIESLMWILLLAVPLAALFSALSLAFAMFARSSKEGQYYLTPLLMVTLGLTIFCQSPAVEINGFYSIMPIMGPALLLKAMLLAPLNAGHLYWYAVPVLISSVGYSIVGLWWAIELFNREDILFREAERFDVRLWVRHLLREKESLPSFSEAIICFVIIMLMQFLAMRSMGGATIGLSEAELPLQMMKLLIIQQLAIIATPALIMTVMLTTSFRQTLRLYWPRWSLLAAGAGLAFVLHPLTSELSMYLSEIEFFPALPPDAQQALMPLLDAKQPIWLVLLTFAIAPGLCEEIAFRGFILSGFSQKGRTTLAIVLSSLLFGAMHMFPQQVYNAALLGLVLGLLAMRSGSLLPGVVFHMIYNGTEVLRNRVVVTGIPGTPLDHLVTAQQIEGTTLLRYDWPLLMVCAVIAAWAIYWLIGLPAPRMSSPLVTSEGDLVPVQSAPMGRG